MCDPEHALIADGADGTKLLCQDDIGGEAIKEPPIQLIEATGAPELTPDLRIDRRAGEVGRKQTPCHLRLQTRLRRKIAFVRHADKRIRKPQGVTEFGRARQQRADAHRG